MKATRMIAAAVLVLSGLAAAPHASARGPFYFGGSVGATDIDSDIAIPGLITSGTVDGRDTGFKIFGGYEFFRNFGVEIALVDLGKASYSGSFYGSSVTGGKVDVWGFNASAVGILPLSPDFSLFGKLGVFSWEAEWSDVTGGVPLSRTEYGADLSVGVGASYNFTKNLSARFEWERFKVGGGEDYSTGQPNATGSANIDLLSIGVLYKF